MFEHHDDDGPTTYHASRLAVPVCAACLQSHRMEGPEWSLPARLLLCFRSFLIIPVIGASVMLYLVMPRFVEMLLRVDLLGVVSFGAVVAFFGAIALLSLRAAWNETERFAVPPPTSVSRGIAWSEDRSAMFEAERHSYSFANAQFAAAMLDANRDRVWDPRSPAARLAKGKRTLVISIGAGVLLLLALIGFLQEQHCTSFHTF